MPVYLALNGPNTAGKPAKAPREHAWSSPDYAGVDPETYSGWIGLRTDGLVVIDCDSEDAVALWRTIGASTTVVKTPRGAHFYYRWVPGSPMSPTTNVLPGVDIRAGRGAQVVCPPTPGYTILERGEITAFDPAWIPTPGPQIDDLPDDTWEIIPEGRRNSTLHAIAGGLRRQGMGVQQIAYTLAAINKRCCDPQLELEEIVVIATSAGRYAAEPDSDFDLVDDEPLAETSNVLVYLDQMRLPPPAEWYWAPYIPKGRLVLLDGSEGIGKGMFCCYLANQLAHDGVNVLWASTEDDPEEDIQRRMLAAGWSDDAPGRVGFFTVPFQVPPSLDALTAIVSNHEAGLLILDPGRAFLAPPDGVRASYNDEAAVRPGLTALHRLAKAQNVTILFVHHWNKDRQTTIQYRSQGTGAFAQVVRHRITMAQVGEEGAFAVTKSNIGPKGGLRGYEILPHDDPALDTAYFVPLDRIHDHQDLSDWLKSAESVPSLDLSDLDTDAIGLPPGTPWPSSEQLRAQYGLSQAAARRVNQRLIDDGYLIKTARGLVRTDKEGE